MKFVKESEYNLKSLCYLLAMSDNLQERLESVANITFYLTSDDYCIVNTELYDNNIVRYTIYGTKSQLSFNYDWKRKKFVRKPYKAKSWHKIQTCTHIDRIQEVTNQIVRQLKSC